MELTPEQVKAIKEEALATFLAVSESSRIDYWLFDVIRAQIDKESRNLVSAALQGDDTYTFKVQLKPDFQKVCNDQFKYYEKKSAQALLINMNYE